LIWSSTKVISRRPLSIQPYQAGRRRKLSDMLTMAVESHGEETDEPLAWGREDEGEIINGRITPFRPRAKFIVATRSLPQYRHRRFQERFAVIPGDLHLAKDHPVISASGIHQFLVGTAFDHAPLFHQ